MPFKLSTILLLVLVLSACGLRSRDEPRHTESPAKPETVDYQARLPVQPSHPVATNVQVENAPAPTTPKAPSVDDETRRAVLQFVADVTNDDAATLTRVNAAFESGMQTEAGTHLDAAVDPVFAATIQALTQAGYMLSFKRDASNEILAALARDPKVFQTPLSLNLQLDQYIEQLAYGLELGPDDYEYDEPTFALACQELEARARGDGRYLLSLLVPASDNHHIVATEQSVYERWRNVAFQPNVAVTPLAWGRVWADIAYTIYDTEVAEQSGRMALKPAEYRSAKEVTQ